MRCVVKEVTANATTNSGQPAVWTQNAIDKKPLPIIVFSNKTEEKPAPWRGRGRRGRAASTNCLSIVGDYHGARIAYRGGTGSQRSVGQAPARGGAAVGSLWTTRVSNDGLLCSVGSPARWCRDAVMIISHGSVGFGAKKRDSSDPESGLLRPNCRSLPLIPLAVPSLGSRSRESRCGLRYE